MQFFCRLTEIGKTEEKEKPSDLLHSHILETGQSADTSTSASTNTSTSGRRAEVKSQYHVMIDFTVRAARVAMFSLVSELLARIRRQSSTCTTPQY